MNPESRTNIFSDLIRTAAQEIDRTLDLRLGGYRLRLVLDDASVSIKRDVLTPEEALGALSVALDPDPITGGLRGDLNKLSSEQKGTIRQLLEKVLHAEGVESINVNLMKSLTERYGAASLQELFSITEEAGGASEICISDFGALPPITTRRFNMLGSHITVVASDSGVDFQMTFNGQTLSLRDAWAAARSKVFNLQNNAAALPGFGALDIDNVTPFAQAIWDGLGSLDKRSEGSTSYIVDIGAAGYGSTSMMILSLLDAKLSQSSDRPNRNIVVHLVDPSFDETVDRLADSGLLKVDTGESNVPLSATTKSYLPPESMRPGHLFLRLCREDPELIKRLKGNGVEIVVNKMGSDEFFGRNSEAIRGNTILSLVDGNHGGSTTKEGQGKEIQPLNDAAESLKVLVDGGAIIFDDYKPTPNVGLVQVTIDTIKRLVSENDRQGARSIDWVERAMGDAYKSLRTALGKRVEELNRPQFERDPKSEEEVRITDSYADQLVELSKGVTITQIPNTPVVVMVKSHSTSQALE